MNTDLDQLKLLTQEVIEKDEALKKSEEHLRIVTDNMIDSLAELDENGKYVFITPSHHRMLGYSLEELKNVTGFSLVHPEDLSRIEKIYTTVLINNLDSISYETRLLHKDGHYINVDVRAKALRDKSGKIIGCILSSRDITEQRQIEDKLKKQEDMYGLIINNINDILFIQNMSGEIEFVSPSIKRVSEFAQQELLGKSFLDVVYEEDMGKVLNDLEFVAKNKKVRPVEYRVIDKKNRLRYIRVTGSLVNIDGVEKLVGFVSDITDLKNTEFELRKSQELYKMIIENVNEVVIVTNMNGVIEYISPTIKNMTKYSVDDLIGKPFSDFVYREEVETSELTFSILLEKGSVVVERRIVDKDGSCKYIRSSSRICTINNEQKIFGVISDIDEKKKAEIDLLKSEQRYRTIVEDQTELICRFLPNGILTFANGAFVRYFNYKREQLTGTNIYSFIDPEAKPQVSKIISELCVEDPIREITYKVIVNNNTRWQRWTKRMIFDERGEPLVIQAVGRDVTDQVKLEELVYKRCNLLQTMSDNMEALVWVKDTRNRYLFASKIISERVLDCTPDQAVGFSDMDIAVTFKNKELEKIGEHRIITDNIVKELMTSCRFYEIYEKDGEELWFDVKKSPLFDMGGNLVGTIGVAFDITKDGNDIKRGLSIRLKNGMIKEIVPNYVYQLERV